MDTGPMHHIQPSDIQKFADSNEGKKILSILKEQDNGKLMQAAQYALQGRMDLAGDLLQKLLADHSDPNSREQSNGK